MQKRFPDDYNFFP
jgi:tubulin polyglutamylase TTLL6/13